VTLPKALTPFNRLVTNRIMRPAAPFVAPLALLEHTGRRSGHTFRTPIFAFRSPRGWVVALTYGPDVDWLRNVQAAGAARLHARGRSYAVSAPERLHGAAGARLLPAVIRGPLRLMNVDEFVDLHAEQLPR
jgi:deazaflavin-dependent oxidoreductase (nitroreductase family)